MQAGGTAFTSRMNSAARIVGLALSLASLVFVGLTVHRSFGGLRQELFSPPFLMVVAGSVLAYAIILQLVGLAWHRLLTAVDGRSFGVVQALAICGTTQIYKYLPSNVLHIIGRFGFARKAGASNRGLAFAQIGELLAIVLAAAAVGAVLARPVVLGAFARYGLDDPASATILLIIGVGVVAIGIWLIVRVKILEFGRAAHGAFATAFVLYVLFFIGNGLLVVALSRSLTATGSAGELIGIGAVAWLVGFIVPGAPGGLGVRDAVLIGGLSAAGLPMTAATAVALGHRLLTTVGDVFVAVVASLMKR